MGKLENGKKKRQRPRKLNTHTHGSSAFERKAWHGISLSLRRNDVKVIFFSLGTWSQS